MNIQFDDIFGTLEEARNCYQRYIDDLDRVGMSSKGVGADTLRKRLIPDRDVRSGISQLLTQTPQSVYKVLDVGAGIVTSLGTRCGDSIVEVTAIDPMAKCCNMLLEEAGITPPVRTQFGFAESVRLQFADDYFDLVFSENGVDHFSDPVASMRAMFHVVKPGGFLVLSVAPREGENNGYDGMHKWNVDSISGHGVLWGLSTPPVTIDRILDVRASDVLFSSFKGIHSTLISFAIKRKGTS